jgi:glycosyltransferase involved in cell wall biosynthesis
MSVKVSVVIPVFNRPEAVCRAVRSVLDQTCQDFEIIVVDDGSTDETSAAVSELADARITLIRHECNRGGSAARNTGIRAGAAPLVAFLDSDDEWMPTKLERQLEAFQRVPQQVALVSTGALRVYPNLVEVDIPTLPADLVRALLTRNVIGETSRGMVRRSALEAVGGFDETLTASQDMDLWLRICSKFEAHQVPEALVRVRKFRDRDRITLNIAAALTARDRFRQKHRDKLVADGVLHLSLRESSWLALREGRDGKRARQYLIEAAVAKPSAVATYGLLILGCLPLSWLDALAWIRNRLPDRNLQRQAWFSREQAHATQNRAHADRTS